MAELSYKDQQDLKNIEKIREHLQILPRFCGEYFRSLEIRKSTNTRKNYAYDLGVFFYFLKTNNPYFKDKDIHTLPIEVLDMITAMDVEEYLSYLESYTKDGKLYTNREEGKARKLSSLKSFYDYYFKKNLIRTNPPRQVDVPKIKNKNINVKVLILTVHGEIEYLLKAVDIGVDGYILKDSESSELKKAINAVINGESYIQPKLIPALNNRLVARDVDKDKIDLLTARELEVLIQVANGKFNKEIATSLNISERTVKNHISNIFKKIEVADRTQAAVFAIKNDIIKLF